MRGIAIGARGLSRHAARALAVLLADQDTLLILLKIPDQQQHWPLPGRCWFVVGSWLGAPWSPGTLAGALLLTLLLARGGRSAGYAYGRPELPGLSCLARAAREVYSSPM